MDNHTWQPIIRTLLDHHRSGQSWTTEAATIPAEAYVGEQRLAAERSLIDSRPQVVGLSADLPDSGSFFTRDHLSVPLVVIRGEDGVAQGFANVCAHRGAQVVEAGRGCRRRHACPYHAWTYSSAGDLVGVPDQAAFPGLEVPSPGLKPLPTFEENGVVWVTVQPTTASVDGPHLGPIGDDLDTFDIDGHRHWRAHRFELDINWKLVVDTFLEPYHFAALHKTTVGPLFMSNLCIAEAFGPHVREVLPRRTITELEGQPEETWDVLPHSALVYVLFPNTVFIMQVDHIETWRVIPHPTDPGRCVTDLDFYIPHGELSASAERHWEKNWQLTIDTVINEDFAAMAGVQRGLASGVLDQLTVGANEPALGLYHAAMAEALAETPVRIVA